MPDYDRFSEQYDPEPEPGPSPAEYAEDSVGAVPAGVKIRCESCRQVFELRPAQRITCPGCGASLEARRP